MLGENFIGSAVGFSNADFGWASPGILELHHISWAFALFKVLNGNYNSHPWSLIQIELPGRGSLGFQELLLRNSLRLCELLPRYIQGALRKTVGSVSLISVYEKPEQGEHLKKELRLNYALAKIFQQHPEAIRESLPALEQTAFQYSKRAFFLILALFFVGCGLVVIQSMAPLEKGNGFWLYILLGVLLIALAAVFAVLFDSSLSANY